MQISINREQADLGCGARGSGLGARGSGRTDNREPSTEKWLVPPFLRDGDSLHKGRAGFTLSELLIASGIMAFVLVGLLHLLIACIFLNEASRNLSIATAHGQYLLEEMKNTNWANLQNLDWDWDSNEIGANGLTPLSNESIDSNIVDNGYLEITVTLAWKDFGLRDKSLVLRTLLTEP